ncbi:calcium-translocating P-type ATPase, SERCA-type [Pueribacillus theae]|uniref:Calcium-translocating P-type ATPase, SERCA-type n=1 Tax=Pueribacillus theae TaxID=2171751 RepID=A0A2U1K7T7_9BACI|nr:calcium-translocating P-type ATPase, SERCA-type [Pueribacillus theae]PWA13452.1 calcium-translocating P-type ATPase, SERCA-type [Pueribacillus theae]
MNWFGKEVDEIEKELNSNIQKGLTSKQAAKKLEKHGLNQLDEPERKSALLIFLSQFKDFLIVVLLAATLISGLLGEYIDAIAIILIVLLNGVLGFVQERKAEKSLQALKQLTAPKTKVLRDGKWTEIPTANIAIGDIVKIESGNRIGADIRLIDAKSLYVDESALTGESQPSHKDPKKIFGTDPIISDQHNMLFKGTLAVKGSGLGIVVATGMKTEMGKIAHLIQNTVTLQTPLQRKLEQLGKILIVVALFLTALVVLVGILHGHDLYTMFLAGVSLAVAAIPEGLPAVVTISLALGVQKMIKRRAIVRKLPAVETLGCATVICSDKTGTLTQNKMTVTHIWAPGKLVEVSGTGYEPVGSFSENGKAISIDRSPELKQLLTFGLLCSNATIVKEKEYKLDGDPTEGALVVAAMKAGLHPSIRHNDYKMIHEFPFDSQRKMMSVIVENKRKERFVITKGAPDVVLANSNRIAKDGKQKIMSSADQREIERAVEYLGSKALRAIAVAYKPLLKSNLPTFEHQAESNLTFIGMTGMIDPPRPEVKEAIKGCHEAGIKTVMITGDHVMTANAIAKDLGILPQGGKTIDGQTLANMTVEQLNAIIEDVYVFARVSPEHKLKIVKAFQENGHVVAMTGDGVNDAPAIKAADIGIAMGITGTDVAKEASSLILSDDNFSTIRAAIEEGRNIYENIRKFIRYMLASNVGEILVMLFAMLMGLPLPLIAIQILWVNLITDGLPAMALAVDSAERESMQRPPRKTDEGIFAGGLGWKIISRGFLIGLVSLIAFLIAYETMPLEKAQTITFSTLVLAQLIHVFDCRSEYSVFHRNPFENKPLLLAVLSSLLLLVVVIYYEPLQAVFHTVPLHISDWLLIVGLSSIPTILLAGFNIFRK